MELKDFIQASCVSGAQFQSHLYGIESQAERAEAAAGLVSIAPLWN